jgi:hypothetical protein
LKSQVFAEFPADERETLPALCRQLLDEQIKNWPRMAKAYQDLSAVRTRSISCSDYEVRLQFNPQRAASSGADVDKEAIKERPCFLCSANRPPGQKGILYQNDYLILGNPAPVLEKHLTIVHLQHLPQAISPSFSCFLDLARDLASGYTVFYNGAASGASAPDHLHFQAIPADALPLEQSFSSHFSLIKDAAVKLYKAEKTDRSAIALAGTDKDSLKGQFDRLIRAAQKIIPGDSEPMINLLCNYNDGIWRLIIFLRSQHRPAAFFAPGEQRIFVSPGAIDMAGVIITPLINNFQGLDAAQIRGIYREVSLPCKTLTRIITAMN